MKTNNRRQPEYTAPPPLPVPVEGYDTSAAPVLYGCLSQGTGADQRDGQYGLYFPMPVDLIDKTLKYCGLDTSQAIWLRLGALSGPEELLPPLAWYHTILPDGNLLREINAMCGAVAELSAFQREKLGAVILLAKPDSPRQIAWLCKHLEAFEYTPHARTPEDYAKSRAQLDISFGHSVSAGTFRSYEKRAVSLETSGRLQFNRYGCVDCFYLSDLQTAMRRGASRQTGLKRWEKERITTSLRSNIAEYIRQNGTLLSETERSDAYSGSDSMKVAWHGRTYELTYIDGALSQLKKLEEHEFYTLHGSRRLTPEDIVICDEVMEIRQELNFYIASCDGMEELLGPLAKQSNGFAYANFYADYRLETGQLRDTLSVTIVRTDGTEAECAYWLNPAEKAMLRAKMDAYCKEQTGQSLEQYRRRYQEERIAAGQVCKVRYVGPHNTLITRISLPAQNGTLNPKAAKKLISRDNLTANGEPVGEQEKDRRQKQEKKRRDPAR